MPTIKVREVLRRLRRDGWYQVRQSGSHRQFWHQTKPGTVTVAGKGSEDMRPELWNAIQRQAGWK